MALSRRRGGGSGCAAHCRATREAEGPQRLPAGAAGAFSAYMLRESCREVQLLGGAAQNPALQAASAESTEASRGSQTRSGSEPGQTAGVTAAARGLQAMTLWSASQLALKGSWV